MCIVYLCDGVLINAIRCMHNVYLCEYDAVNVVSINATRCGAGQYNPNRSLPFLFLNRVVAFRYGSR